MSKNVIKVGSADSNSIQKGPFAVGASGLTDYGPTSRTGYYAGINVPTGGYVFYAQNSNGKPSIQVAYNDTQALFFLKSYGATGTTLVDAIAWAGNQSNLSYFIADIDKTTILGVSPTPTPTPTSTSITSTPTPTPTITSTKSMVAVTSTPTPSVTSTSTNTPTSTPTLTPTPSPAASVQYYYGSTAELAHGMTSGLTGVNLYGSDLCSANSMAANEFNYLPNTAPIYIYDSVSQAIRQATPLGYYPSANLNLGPCTYQ